MRYLLAVIAAATLLVTGCTAAPTAPTEVDYNEIISQRLDSVWMQSELPSALRPEVQSPEPRSQLSASMGFSGCMRDRGWPDYEASPTGYRYRAIQLADSQAERLDWYECFALNPVDAEYTMQSVEQFDLVYDYYQDVLIPCLEESGNPIDDAPTRMEFRTTWLGWSDPLFPFIWNPYHPLQKHGAVDTSDLQRICAPEPPNQDFYAFEG